MILAQMHIEGGYSLDITAETLNNFAGHLVFDVEKVIGIDLFYPIVEKVNSLVKLDEDSYMKALHTKEDYKALGQEAILIAKKMVELEFKFLEYGVESININSNHRGFAVGKFIDLYGTKCSIQESSLASKEAIWLGVDDAKPEIMAEDAMRRGLPTGGASVGRVAYKVPEEVSFTTRMHLTRKQVRSLLPLLQRFVDTGEIREVDEHRRYFEKFFG